MKPTNIATGDIHGALEPSLNLLETENLIDRNHHWIAGDTHLVFLGDYMDRGPDGIGVIDTIMRLETEATNAGGRVSALLGNHDVIMLEVHHFGDALSPGFLRDGIEKSFRQMWLENAGGQIYDLERLEARHVEWLEQRPAMMKIGETLLMHADSEFYLQYGSEIEEINTSIRSVLLEKDVNNLDIAREFVSCLGATRIVHGHTPIRKLRNIEPQEVTEPLEYANGVCVNVDHGLCYGGEGFVYAF